MSLPTVLKQLNLHVEGESLYHQIEEVKLPKLAFKTEEYKGGGMPAPVSVDSDMLEKLDLEWTVHGFYENAIKQLANRKVGGLQLRFMGAYQAADSDDIKSVEISCRGKHDEVDNDKAKAGDKQPTKVKTSLSYYKLMVNGQVLVEIDTLGMICIIDGKDLLADKRKAIGLM